MRLVGSAFCPYGILSREQIHHLPIVFMQVKARHTFTVQKQPTTADRLRQRERLYQSSETGSTIDLFDQWGHN